MGSTPTRNTFKSVISGMKLLITLFALCCCTIVDAQKTQYPVEPEIVTVAKWHRPPCEIIVDLSDQTCKVVLEDKTVTFWAEGSEKGIGYVLESNQTPTGKFLFVKQPRHRYGLVLRLTGPPPADINNPDITSGWYQGWKRGILVHKDYGDGSKGCVNLSTSNMNKLYNLVIANYDQLIIQE